MRWAFDEGEPLFTVNNTEGEYIANAARNKHVLEIGCYKGRSTAYLQRYAKSITVLDTFTGLDENTLNEFMKNIKDVIILIGTTDNILPILNLCAFDMIFHDGSHDYEQVIKDLSWIRCLFHGVLIMHDFTPEYGVIEATQTYGIVPVKITHRLAEFSV